MDVLTNVAQPKTSATLTVRIIKSFKFRTERSLVLHNVDLTTTTTAQLKDIAQKAILDKSGWKPYRNVLLGLLFFPPSIFANTSLDTLKLYTNAHGAKVIYNSFCSSPNLTLWAQTSNLIINLDHDDWILNNDDGLLADLGFGMPLIHLSTLPLQ